jgi:hypothetical protein
MVQRTSSLYSLILIGGEMLKGVNSPSTTWYTTRRRLQESQARAAQAQRTPTRGNMPVLDVGLDGNGLARGGEDGVAHLHQHLHRHLEAALLGQIGRNSVAVKDHLALDVLLQHVHLQRASRMVRRPHMQASARHAPL